MSRSGIDTTRLRQLLQARLGQRHNLHSLKRMVRNWQSSGSPGQDAVNRAVIRAIDDVYKAIEVLLRV